MVLCSAADLCDERSYASAGEPLTVEMEQVATEAWFPELPNYVEFEVYAQSMKLSSCNTDLFLLCLGDPT